MADVNYTDFPAATAPAARELHEDDRFHDAIDQLYNGYICSHQFAIIVTALVAEKLAE